MADERLLAGTPGTLALALADGNGDPVDVYSVAVRVVRDADGSVLVADPTDAADPTAASGAGSGEWWVDIDPQTALGTVTATWWVTAASGGGDEPYAILTGAEVVGGRLFTAAQLRAADASLADATKVTAADIAAACAEVEDEFEAVTGQSFVRRGAVERLPGGTDVLMLSRPRVLSLTSVTVGGTAVDADVTPDGALTRSSGGRWPTGLVTVDYEHGWLVAPAEVRRAALLRARHRINSVRSGVPDRATSFASSDGGTFTLATAGRGGSETGIPDVDAVLRRYDCRGV